MLVSAPVFSSSGGVSVSAPVGVSSGLLGRQGLVGLQAQQMPGFSISRVVTPLRGGTPIRGGGGSQPGSRVVSPRPVYSWRTRCNQPIGASTSGSVGAEARVGLSSVLPLSAASRPASRPVSATGARTLSAQQRNVRQAGTTRPRTPPLQTRERSRQKVESAQQHQYQSHSASAPSGLAGKAQRNTTTCTSRSRSADKNRPAARSGFTSRLTSPPQHVPAPATCRGPPHTPASSRTNVGRRNVGNLQRGRDQNLSMNRGRTGSRVDSPAACARSGLMTSIGSSATPQNDQGMVSPAVGGASRAGTPPRREPTARTPGSSGSGAMTPNAVPSPPSTVPRVNSEPGSFLAEASMNSSGSAADLAAAAGNGSMKGSLSCCSVGDIQYQSVQLELGPMDSARTENGGPCAWASPAAPGLLLSPPPAGAVIAELSGHSLNTPPKSHAQHERSVYCFNSNMSPLQRVEDPRNFPIMLDEAARGMTSGSRSLASSSDTLAFTSTAPSSLANSRAPSIASGMGRAEAGFSENGASLVPARAALQLRNSTDENIPANHLVAQPAGAHLSKVAQMRSLFEKRCSEQSGGTISSGESKASRVPGFARPNTTWVRNASDSVRRLRQEELKANRQVDRLMQRIHEAEDSMHQREVGLGLSPFKFKDGPGTPSASNRSRSSEASDPSWMHEDENESPNTQIQKSMWASQASHARIHKNMLSAISKFVSLDQRGNRYNARLVGARGDLLPANMLLSEACDVSGDSALSSAFGGIAGSAILRGRDSVPGEEASPLPNRSAQATSQEQPEEEVSEEVAASLAMRESCWGKTCDVVKEVALNKSHGSDPDSGPLADDPEPHREPQPQESPRQSRIEISSRPSVSSPPLGKRPVIEDGGQLSPSWYGTSPPPPPPAPQLTPRTAPRGAAQPQQQCARRDHMHALDAAEANSVPNEPLQPLQWEKEPDDEPIETSALLSPVARNSTSAEPEQPPSCGSSPSSLRSLNQQASQSSIDEKLSAHEDSISSGDSVSIGSVPLESGGAASSSAQPSADEPLSMDKNLRPLGPDSTEELNVDYYIPKPTEESMVRATTMLAVMEREEMQKQVQIIAPDGMGTDRKVQFVYEGVTFDIQIPEGYNIGEEVPIVVPKRPPLERNRYQAQLRDHAHLQDFQSIWSTLRYPPMYCHDKAEDALKNDECMARREHYRQLHGKRMAPLMPYTPEETEEDIES